jgi:hypothetical protein
MSSRFRDRSNRSPVPRIQPQDAVLNRVGDPRLIVVVLVPTGAPLPPPAAIVR